MYFQDVFVASYEVILSLVFGLLTIFITWKILDKSLLKIDTESSQKGGNTALAIIGGSMTISVLILAQASIAPAINALRESAADHAVITAGKVMVSFAYFLLFYVITVIVSILVIFFSTRLYMAATTKIDEVEELKKGNIAVAVMMAFVILGTTFFVRQSLKNFVASLINYERLNYKEAPIIKELAPADTGGIKMAPVVPEKN